MEVERVTIRRILVPVDFSQPSLAGLDYAIELSQSLGASLVALFVAEPLYYGGDIGLLLEEYQRYGREELTRLQSRLKKSGVDCETLLRTGKAYQVICEEAEREHADLIVMSTHGRSGLSHLLLGSVAEKVVRSASRPVLTIRPQVAAAS